MQPVEHRFGSDLSPGFADAQADHSAHSMIDVAHRETPDALKYRASVPPKIAVVAQRRVRQAFPLAADIEPEGLPNAIHVSSRRFPRSSTYSVSLGFRCISIVELSQS